MMTDAEGRSRRFGFVRFYDPEPADLVLADRNGNVVNGVAVTIEKAVPKEQIAADYVPSRPSSHGLRDRDRDRSPRGGGRRDRDILAPSPYHDPYAYAPPPAEYSPYSAYAPPPSYHHPVHPVHSSYPAVAAPPPPHYGAPPPPPAAYGAPTYSYPPAPSAHSAVAAPYASYSNPYATAPAVPATTSTARYQYSYPPAPAPAQQVPASTAPAAAARSKRTSVYFWIRNAIHIYTAPLTL